MHSCDNIYTSHCYVSFFGPNSIFFSNILSVSYKTSLKNVTPSESRISYITHSSYFIFVDAKFKLLDLDQILNLKHTTNKKNF